MAVLQGKVIYLKSLQELLGTSWDMEITCKITDRWRRSCVDGKGLEVPCVYTSLGKPRNCLSYYLWRRLQTARTSCLPLNRLSSKPQQSQKISQNATRQSMSFPGNMSIELAVFKATTVTKEFSKCHSRWQLCPFPRIVSYWLLQSQDSSQRLLKIPRRLLKMPRGGRWPGIASITAIDLI